MAKTRYKSVLDGIRGRVDWWVYRKFLGKTIVSRCPGPQARVRRGAEAANNERFHSAAKAARCAMLEIGDRYIARARELNTTAFGLATRDALNPPRIPVVFLQCYTGQPGQPIFIIARDDFVVKNVFVTLLASNGRLVEYGHAQRCENDVFRYDTTAALPPGLGAQVIVRARDWPSNTTEWVGNVDPASAS